MEAETLGSSRNGQELLSHLAPRSQTSADPKEKDTEQAEDETAVGASGRVAHLETELSQARRTIHEKALEIRRLDATITNLTRSNHTISNMLNKYVKRAHTSAVANARALPILESVNATKSKSDARPANDGSGGFDSSDEGADASSYAEGTRSSSRTDSDLMVERELIAVELDGENDDNSKRRTFSEEIRDDMKANTNVVDTAILDELRQELQDLSTKDKEKEKLLQESQEKLATLEEAHKRLEKNNLELSTSYLDCQSQLESKESELQLLQGKLKSTESASVAENEQLHTLEKLIDEVQTRLADKEALLQEKNDFCEALQSQLETLNKKLHQQTESAREFENSEALRVKYEESKSELEQKITTLTSEVQRTSTANEDLTSQVDALRKSKEELSFQVEALQSKSESAEQKLAENQMMHEAALQAADTEKVAEISKLRMENEELSKRVEEQEKEHGLAEQEHKNLMLSKAKEEQEQQTEAAHTAAQMNEANNTLQNRIRDLEAKIELYQSTSGKELQKLQLDLKEAREIEKQLREELTEAEQALEAANIRQLWRKLATLEEALEQERGTSQLKKDKHSNSKESSSKK